MPYDITSTTFPARTYLVWRKEVKIKDLQQQNLWQTAFAKINEYAQKNNVKITGPGTALYFRWDEEAGVTELAIGNPVEGVTTVSDPDVSLISIPESKAITTTLQGGYDKLKEAHAELKAYLATHNITEQTRIEEYLVTGMDAPDPKDWKTAIYSLQA